MKQKKRYIAITAIFMLAIFIYSCRKDLFSDEVKINPKIGWAKSYFTESLLPKEGNMVDPMAYIQNSVQAARMSKVTNNMKIPIWQKAIPEKTPLFDIVEVPLKYTTKITPMLYINPSANFSATPDKDVLKASYDRLIIYKNKKGEIKQRIVSFVPTKDYLERHKGDISHNRINKIDKDFDGALVYREWNGKLLYALFMKDGKAVRKLLLQAPKMKVKKTAFMPQECETVILWEWFQVCYYYGDEELPTYCDPPYKEEVGSYDMCWDGDPCEDPMNAYLVECGGDGGNGGEPGGGGSPQPPPAIDMGETVSDEVESIESDLIVGIDSFKVAVKTWNYHEGATYNFSSKEKLIVKVKNGNRTWHSINHISKDDEGGWIYGTVELVDFTNHVHLPASSTGNAWAEVDYKLIFKFGVGPWTGPHPSTGMKWSAAAWDTQFIKQ
jgi:hypothetical protein